MKLNEVTDLREKLFAITGNGGLNDHVHRLDPSMASGKTTVDEGHFHNYTLGDKETTGTVNVIPDADVDHSHSLPMITEGAAPKEKMLHFLRSLEKEDFQDLATYHHFSAKPNEPLNLRVFDEDHGIRIEAVFYNTKDNVAVEILNRRITPMLKELGVGVLAPHYHIERYQPPLPPVDNGPEDEPAEIRLPRVDFEYVKDKEKLTAVIAVISSHRLDR